MIAALLATAATKVPQDTSIQTEETFLFLGLPETWVLGLVVVPILVAFAWWCYGGLSRLEPRTRVVLATLRGLAIAFALFLLFQPAIERVRYTEVQTQVHVLIDDSASMSRQDTYPDAEQHAALEQATGGDDIAGSTRTELVQRVLSQPDGLLAALGEEYDVRLFRFVRKPQPIRDLGELQSRGARTAIGDALDLHLAAATAVGLDALILVTDGRSNDGLDPVEAARKYRLEDTAVFTVGVGDPNPPRNIRLIGPPGPENGLRREELVFECTLDAEGLEDREVNVTMLASRDGGGYLPLASQPARLGADHEPVKVRLYHAFEEAGDYTLRFEVDRLPEETSHADNRAVRFLRVEDEKIRVLLIDDVPRWDYRFAKEALRRVDASIEMQAFLFDATRSFTQHSSDELPPLVDLPRTREELFEYQVILLGDVPPERLAATEEGLTRWLDLLVEFVEAGGGVGFQWGPQAMPERYRNTPLQDLLPVVLESRNTLRSLGTSDGGGFDTPFQPQLDNPAQPHDMVLLRRDPDANQRLWERGFSPFFAFHPVQKAKAGAQVLLRHSDRGNRYGEYPLLVTGFYPRGRTMFLATDEMWRIRNPYGERYYDRFWRNVVRHLASGRLDRRDERYDLQLDRATVDTGGQVAVTLLVQDQELQPLLTDEVTVFVRPADGEPEPRILRPIPGEPGAYRGRLTMDKSGSFSFLAFENDNPAGRIVAREDLLVRIPDREMANSSQDRAALESIAAATEDGRHVFLADAATLAEDLSGRRAFDSEVDRSTRPIWDSGWSLFALLGLLGAEWILRKRARLV